MLVFVVVAIVVLLGMTLFTFDGVLNKDNPLAADGQEVSDEARKALAEMNTDTEISKGLLNEMKKTDPNVLDVYTSVDGSGTKTITMVRQRDDGSVEETTVPASTLKKWEQEALEQNPAAGQAEANDGSSGAGSDMIMGAFLGYMASRMFMMGSNTGAGVTNFANRDAQQKSRTAAVSRYRQSFSPALSSLNRSGSNFRGQTSRGSFSSSGARSGGYSSGG